MKIQDTVARKIQESASEMFKTSSFFSLLKKFLVKRGVAADRIEVIVSDLEAHSSKLKWEHNVPEDLPPPEIDDGFGIVGDSQSADEAEDEESTNALLQSSTTVLENFAPYWITNSTGRLHKTGAVACPWDPRKRDHDTSHRWVDSVGEARRLSRAYCRKCWPTGMDEEEASEVEDLLGNGL